MFENKDLRKIVTPVKPKILKRLLLESGYDRHKTNYLINGFNRGFSINFKGNKFVKRTAPYLKLRVGSKLELWNKVMTEVKDKRFAGPFKEVPFDHFIQSPIGLVPKDKGTKTRLIFHLSYPKKGESVNAGIPHDLCTVQYPSFDEAVKLCILAGRGCSTAKSDMARAFRNIPLRKSDWRFLVMKAEHPLTGETFYFVDKCLPFGSSISCAIFQDFSNAIAFLVTYQTGSLNVNYLDDFFFAALRKQLCDLQVKRFLEICRNICFPVSLEKTCWGTCIITFLGLLLDTVNQRICIPLEKIRKAIDMIEYLLNKKNKKATVLQFQRLCGTLNFLCKCVVPGRAFVTRLYPPGHLLQHHHLKITQEHRGDLEVWRAFLNNAEVFSRPFMDFKKCTAKDIDMYSDASRNFSKGVGAYCGPSWSFKKWNQDFMENMQPSIQYLELYGVTVAVLNWIKHFKNRRIYLFCDNDSVVKMINKSSSRCRNCMVLLRLITLEGLIHNVRIFAKHVTSKDNGKADALSRLEFQRFWKLCDEEGSIMDVRPTSIPSQIWPIEKIWLSV